MCNVCVCVYSAHQAPLSLKFSRQAYWSGLPFPPPGESSCSRIKPINVSCVSCIGQRILYYWCHLGSSCVMFVVVQSPGRVWLFATPWTEARQTSLYLTISWSLPKFMFIALVMLSSHLILCCPLFLLPSVFPSTSDFSNELSLCIRRGKYWSFTFQWIFRVDLP